MKMRKNLLFAFLIIFSVSTFAQRVANTLTPLVQKNYSDNLQFQQAEGDTLFYYDCSNLLYMDETDYESFEIMMEDFDEGVPSPYDGETDADVLEYVSSFFWQYTTDQPNGVATFDYDENTDPSVPDSAWYFTAYSWFTDLTLQADNWLGMGPVTNPDEGAALKFHYRGAVSQWKDGFDLYITEGGMEPYNDVDPGETDIAYSIEDAYPAAGSDSLWAEHTVSLNNFAGKSIYFTFHHTATDKERIMLDEFLIVETDDMYINESDFDALKISPNPSNGIFTVTSNTSNVKTIEVVNILGEVIHARDVNGSINETFDMSSFSAGMYFVKSSNGTTKSTQRIIIK